MFKTAIVKTDVRYNYPSEPRTDSQLCYEAKAGEFLPRTSAWIAMVEILDCLNVTSIWTHNVGMARDNWTHPHGNRYVDARSTSYVVVSNYSNCSSTLVNHSHSSSSSEEWPGLLSSIRLEGLTESSGKLDGESVLWNVLAFPFRCPRPPCLDLCAREEEAFEVFFLPMIAYLKKVSCLKCLYNLDDFET